MKLYTEKDLIDFGNKLLSEQREENLVNEVNKRAVTDADVANFEGGLEAGILGEVIIEANHPNYRSYGSN